MELLDPNMNENRPTPKGNSYFIGKKNNTNKKAEAVNKLLKDTCTYENIHFICHSNIKPHLNRRNLHLNDHGISALVKNFKNFLNNFDSVLLQNKHNLNTASRGSLSSENSDSCFSLNKDILRICKQRIGNALNTINGHLKINFMRNKFILAENIIKAFDIFLIQNQS